MIYKKLRNNQPNFFFRNGNAGDIITSRIIEYIYNRKSINISDSGNRLLITGSIAGQIRSGDVLCGIGTKGDEIPSPNKANCRILGLRGPITYDLFKRAGHNLTELKFLRDPGLLIRYLVEAPKIEPRGAGFLPHYRERGLCKIPKNKFKFIDIDNDPIKLAHQILSCEIIYTSSLHGIIFSHALGRPCVWLMPMTDEPIIKYHDYFESVDILPPKPVSSISEVKFINSPTSPADISYTQKDFHFPNVESLEEYNILQ